ncbi:Eukaryotic translation initiation factor 2A [Wickerhamiella sorbophila]|uniref:Eukaryotic translation initiation factor 2A n=1 Tax=Wickerhamiella sorbophila TaxID=45607 RepID=A0A2T0FF88_9ASCO|nr:Eukaryotic translation initiation factor 2A [Wickerhamiella sorbophila]PRT53662.1 Eukaryotic translation initiation factor 2A [Wickerhamiella sorbophila]
MTQYFSRAAKSLVIRRGVGEYDETDFEKPVDSARIAIYSLDGSRFAYATASETTVVDPDSGAVLARIPVAAADLYFSPKGTFIVTWVRPKKNSESGNWENNLLVWAVASPESPVGEFLQKSQGSFRGGWSVQWTGDEQFGLRQTAPGTLVAYDASLKNQAGKLTMPDGIAEFSVSPGRNPAVAIFTTGRKGKPPSVLVYKVPALSQIAASRTLLRAESVQLMWNKLGTACLVNATTDVDKSGKTYYGDSTLYLLTVNSGASQRIALDKEGPVHDVAWSPTSDEFAVVYGYMPSKTTFFDTRGNNIHSLPLASRNTLKFSPQGRFVVVAGFGNLQGQVDIYDRGNKYAKVTNLDAPNTSYFDWSPCGRYILTATTSPRLRVDNGVKIWHYSGRFMYAHDDEELFSVGWRPEEIPLNLTEPIPEPHESVANRATAAAPKPKSAYRPPHARGGAEVARTSLYQRTMAAEPAADQSKAASKNKKKREAKRAAEGTKPAPGNGAEAPATTAAVAQNPEDKLVRSLLKKLRAIRDLKERQASGEKLELTQVQKITTENDVLTKLASLGWSE